MVGIRPILRDLLTYGVVRRVCPDCQRPEALKMTCRHCGSEYPPAAIAQVAEKILRLGVGVVVAVVVLMTALLIATLLLKYVFSPMLVLILRG